jgi:secondary thiamine-phosphate synthase enzyme
MTSRSSISHTAPSKISADAIASSVLTVQTPGAGFTNLTAEIAKFVNDTGGREGLVTLFIRHTSASLTIQENADPTVLGDLKTALDRLAPEDAGWRHDVEGPDDMPAHIKTMMTATVFAIVAATGNIYSGLWYPVGVAIMSLIIGFLFLPETKDVDIRKS